MPPWSNFDSYGKIGAILTHAEKFDQFGQAPVSLFAQTTVSLQQTKKKARSLSNPHLVDKRRRKLLAMVIRVSESKEGAGVLIRTLRRSTQPIMVPKVGDLCLVSA